MNKAILIGRLTKNPDTKTLTTGTVATNFTLAINRNFKNKEGKREADFVPVVAFGKTAELIDKYLNKGDLTSIVGRIQTRTYEAKDGTKRYITEVIAEEIVFLSTKRKDESGIDGFEEIEEDGSPF